MSWFHNILGRPPTKADDTDALAEPQVPARERQRPPQVQGNLATEAAPDRRASVRVALELQVRLRFESAEAMVASRTFDISRGGAFISIRNPRPRGTKVRLTLQVQEQTIVIGGLVVRSSAGKAGKAGRRGMGIQFTEITPEAAEALALLLGPHDA